MATPNSKVMFGDAFIGSGVQRTIKKETTYRLRRGNGQYGSKLGVLYQDKYPYYVPDPSASHCPDAAKLCFANAVSGWQALNAAGKQIWNNLAHHIQHLSGYNLFIKRYMEENYP